MISTRTDLVFKKSKVYYSSDSGIEEGPTCPELEKNVMYIHAKSTIDAPVKYFKKPHHARKRKSWE